MAIGLTKVDSPEPLIDTTQLPWSTLKSKDIKPSAQQMKDEVERRAKQNPPAGPHPHPKYWNIKALLEWLNKNPITKALDVTFIRTETDRLLCCLTEQQEEQARISQGQWRGSVPMLRLIHCLVDNDDIKGAFLRRADVHTRREIDARNSDVRDPTVWEMMADKWNDPSFDASTLVSDCHEEFAESIPVNHAEVAHLLPADPTKVENKFVELRANLLRIIDNWSRSGQGEGGRSVPLGDEEPEEAPTGFGSLQEASEEALQNRRNFLQGRPPFILYYWELADRLDLLKTTCQKMSSAVGAADAGQAPSTFVRRPSSTSSRRVGSGGRGPRNHDPEEVLFGSVAHMAQGQDDMIRSQEKRQLLQLLHQLRESRRSLQEKRFSSQDPEAKKFYLEQVREVDEEIRQNESMLQAVSIPVVVTTPVRRNKRSADSISQTTTTRNSTS